VYNGIFLFNACLVGTVIPSLYPVVYSGTMGAAMWIILVIASAMT
jgi:hypothetical protein